MLTNKVKAWRFGTIKFYSTQKGFGYLYCKSEQYKIKEYFFDSTALQKGEVLENQNVCFYFGMENGKLKICEISPITLELFNNKFNEFDYYLKKNILENSSKNIKLEIDKLIIPYLNQINLLKQDPHFKTVYLDIEEILSYFNITFQISYHYNPGDDDSLWVGYVLENKKLDYCNFPDLEDFVNPIINLRGYRSFHNLKEEFESDRSTYENKIPTILETVKTEFKKNYVLKKEMDYEYKLTPILRQEIIHSICMDGWDKTINSLEKIFDKFTQKAKQTSFPIKYSLSITGNK